MAPKTASRVSFRVRVNGKCIRQRDMCEEAKDLTLSEQEIPEEIKKSIIVLPLKIVPTVAFAIDIDGVLLNKHDPLPGALATIRKLHDIKIPFVLLTNRLYYGTYAGTMDLRKSLALPTLRPSQLIFCLTPFKLLLPRCFDKPVLVVDFNGERNRTNRKVMTTMGFQDVYIPEDFYEVYPEVAPAAFFNSKPWDPATRAREIRDCRSNEGSKVEISAILVFGTGDSSLSPAEEFARSPNKLLTQILKSQSGDLREPARSNGDKSFPNDGYQQSHAPMIYYEISSNEYQRWRRQLQLDWKKETGRDLLHQHEIGGKPASSMFTYAKKMLDKQQKILYGEYANSVEKIVMIGDTPSCDVTGTNWYKKRPGQGDAWKSALVEGGTWNKERDGVPKQLDAPNFLAPGIEAAVRWGLETFGMGDPGTLEDITTGDGHNDEDTCNSEDVKGASLSFNGGDSKDDEVEEFDNQDSDYEKYEDWDVSKHNESNEYCCYTQYVYET
ncbi:hypothetical protein WAI453_001341 [Rhynchosporium graminicola]